MEYLHFTIILLYILNAGKKTIDYNLFYNFSTRMQESLKYLQSEIIQVLVGWAQWARTVEKMAFCDWLQIEYQNYFLSFLHTLTQNC